MVYNFLNFASVSYTMAVYLNAYTLHELWKSSIDLVIDMLRIEAKNAVNINRNKKSSSKILTLLGSDELWASIFVYCN